MTVTVAAEKDTLLFAILRAFESLALRHYETLAPEIVTDEKRDLVARLHALAPDDAPLAEAGLDARVDGLLAALKGADRREVLINQAFLLELVGSAIYASAGAADGLSEAARDVFTRGEAASKKTRDLAMASLRETFPSGDAFLDALIAVSPKALKQLDPLSEALDRHFGAAYGLNFGDLIGEFVAEVDDAAGELGADRRKLVGFLTHVLMEA